MGYQRACFTAVGALLSSFVCAATPAEVQAPFQDTVAVMCRSGGCGPCEYFYFATDGWIPPVIPNCFGVAPDGTVYLAERDTQERLRIHRFDREGKPLVTYHLTECVKHVWALTVDARGEMYLAVWDPGQYVLHLSQDAVVQGRIARNGPIEPGEVQDASKEDRLFTSLIELWLDTPGEIRVVHTFPPLGSYRVDTFNRETMEVILRDAHVPPEFEARMELLKKRSALLRAHGVTNPVDAKLDATGALWYMTFNERELAIHKVVFNDASVPTTDVPDEEK